MLAQMEQALAAEDPRFVATLRGRRIERATKIRAGIAVLGAVIGLAMVLGLPCLNKHGWASWDFVVMVTATTISLAFFGEVPSSQGVSRRRQHHH
ncbi:MAG: DUF3040 domain-containing protein [Marmoricola sp.]